MMAVIERWAGRVSPRASGSDVLQHGIHDCLCPIGFALVHQCAGKLAAQIKLGVDVFGMSSQCRKRFIANSFGIDIAPGVCERAHKPLLSPYTTGIVGGSLLGGLDATR